jgi:hypothetical protein
MMTHQEKADKIMGELQRIEKKFGCEIGVWLSWRDLYHNFDAMRKDPKIDNAKFPLQVKFSPDEPQDTPKKWNTSRVAGGSKRKPAKPS